MESKVYLSTESLACLSIQRALLDKITPNLRRISFQISEDLISLYFYYDTEPSEIEMELAGDAEAEVISDFPGEYMIEVRFFIVKSPLKVNSVGRVIYERYE